MWACGRMWACHPEHNELDDSNPRLPPLKFKSTRRAVQQQHNSSSSIGKTRGNLAMLVCIGTPVFPLFNLRHPTPPAGISSLPHPEGKPCIWQYVPGMKVVCTSILQSRNAVALYRYCLLYTSPSPRDKRQSRMPSSA